LRDALDPLTYSSVTLTFFGHTHLQGAFWRNGKESFDAVQPSYQSLGQHETFEVDLKSNVQYLINPGSVGQPRDGDWRAAFAWFDSESNKVIFHRAPYDLEHAQQRILEANLPPRLASRLAIGR
jgi:diadenosine tetraphosphatase ApaH/serine/threonine PP2A family protein phosphatase